jgi:hypothetical protein
MARFQFLLVPPGEGESGAAESLVESEGLERIQAMDIRARKAVLIEPGDNGRWQS